MKGADDLGGINGRAGRYYFSRSKLGSTPSESALMMRLAAAGSIVETPHNLCGWKHPNFSHLHSIVGSPSFSSGFRLRRLRADGKDTFEFVSRLVFTNFGQSYSFSTTGVGASAVQTTMKAMVPPPMLNTVSLWHAEYCVGLGAVDQSHRSY